MSREIKWDWIDEIEDLDLFSDLFVQLQGTLNDYLGEEEQSVSGEGQCCPDLESITDDHPVKQVVIDIELACKGEFGKDLLPAEGLQLWKDLRRCDEAVDGSRERVAVRDAARSFLDWVQTAAWCIRRRLKREKDGEDAAWYHDEHDNHPDTHDKGPLQGTKKNLGACLGGKGGPNDRTLQVKAGDGTVWVKRLGRTSFEVWFRNQTAFAEANRIFLGLDTGTD